MMISREAIIGSVAGTIALAAGALPSAAATYGLVVGIDDYIGRSNDLKGAVNDAEDIAAALRRAGAAEIVLLTDTAASKEAIEDAWIRLVNTALPGDTIVFSFAGHGSQEPEPAGRHGEEDGLNETFILAGYQSIGEASAERIVDDEIFAWLRLAEDRGLEVIFVADSCHSGTMYRAVGGLALRYRVGDFEPPADGEALVLPDPRYATTRETDFEHVTFIGATQEDRLTPELMIDGVPRGALSWAFARALEGAADRDGDNALTQHELLAYLVPAVEIQTHNQQTPSILPLAPETKIVIRLGEPTGPVMVPVPANVLVSVFTRGEAELVAMAGIGPTESETAADLVWDVEGGWVDHRIAGRVAENIGPSQIMAVLAKWSALAFVESIATRDPFSMELLSGNQFHVRGEILTIRLGGASRPYLTLFNLAPDGRIELLVPATPDEAETDWRGRDFNIQLRVADPPYGAEHLVAILTDDRPLALQSALTQMAALSDSTGLAVLLASLLETTEVQAGILGIYTAAE